MPLLFSDLPLDVVNLIAGQLDTPDLVRLCATCRGLRDLFVPQNLNYLAANCHSRDPEVEQAARATSYLVLCHAFRRAVYPQCAVSRRHVRIRCALFLRHRATLAIIPHGDLVRDVFLRCGPSRQLRFVLRYGASMHSTPGGIHQLLQDLLLRGRPTDNPFDSDYDFLLAHGASLRHLPCGPCEALNQLLGRNVPLFKLTPLMELCASLGLVAPRLIQHLERAYEQHGLAGWTMRLFDYIPNALNLLLRYALLEDGLGNRVDELLQHGASLQQLIQDEAAHGDLSLMERLRSTDSEGRTTLWQAASVGHKELAKFLLAQGVEHSTADARGWTPLIAATSNDHLDMVRMLLEHGADVSSAWNKTQTPLWFAVSHNNLDIAQLLIEHGASCNLMDSYEWTPLLHSATDGHVRMAKLLLDNGADPNLPSLGPMTPLVAAAAGNYVEVVRVLLKHGADPSKASGSTLTPLMTASRSGHLDSAKLLLDHGADHTATCKDGFTALCYAASEGHPELVDALMERGADCSTQTNHGQTPLALASSLGRLEVVRYLTARTKDVNATDERGNTALLTAAQSGHADCVEVLLASGARIEHRNTDDWSPLHLAAGRGHAETLKTLLVHGADPASTVGGTGATPLHTAAYRGITISMRMLINHSADVNAKDNNGSTPLICASETRSFSAVHCLIDNGADLNAVDNEGRNALWKAAEYGRVEIFEFLWTRGCPSLPSSLGWTPLLAAAFYGHLNVMKFLVEKGISLDEAVPETGSTALEMAASQGKHDIVRWLLEDKHVDPRAHGELEWAPLYAAACSGSMTTVELLLKHGADITVRTKWGFRPLDGAHSSGNKELIRFLRERGDKTTTRPGRMKYSTPVLGRELRGIWQQFGKDMHTIWREYKDERQQERVEKEAARSAAKQNP